MIAEQRWKQYFTSLESKPLWFRYGVFPVVGPAVIAVYFSCMWPRTTGACAAILAAVYAYTFHLGIVDRRIFVNPARAITITYVGMVLMVYVELAITAGKDYSVRWINSRYDDD